MKALLVTFTIGLPLALGGCGLAQQAQQQANAQQFETEARAVLLGCAAQSPSSAVARVRCSNPQLAQLAATYRYADPDLAATFLAKRAEVAERLDAGRITLAQGQLEITTAYQQAAELQLGRRRATQAANAQTQAAAAQSILSTAAILGDMSAVRQNSYFMPTYRPSITCRRNGDITTCD